MWQIMGKDVMTAEEGGMLTKLGKVMQRAATPGVIVQTNAYAIDFAFFFSTSRSKKATPCIRMS